MRNDYKSLADEADIVAFDNLHLAWGADQQSAVTAATDALRDASDEIESLRIVLADAPHDSLCNAPDYTCRCWKADIE